MGRLVFPICLLRLLLPSFNLVTNLYLLVLVFKNLTNFDTIYSLNRRDSLIFGKSPPTVLFKSVLLHKVESIQYSLLLCVMIMDHIYTPKHSLQKQYFARKAPDNLGFFSEWCSRTWQNILLFNHIYLGYHTLLI